VKGDPCLRCEAKDCCEAGIIPCPLIGPEDTPALEAEGETMDKSEIIGATAILEAKSETRVRMNLSQNAKGLVQFEITAEYPTAGEAAAALSDAIDKARAVCEAKGLKMADAAA